MKPYNPEPLEITDEEILYWRSEIEASHQFQKEQFLKRINYDELIRYFESEQTPKGSLMAVLDESSPAIASVIRATYYQNPSCTATATHPAADGFVKPSLMYMLQHPEFKPYKLTDLMVASLKQSMRKSGMKEEMQLGTFDLLVAGFCTVEENVRADQTAPPTGEPAQGMIDKIVSFGKKILGKDEAAEKVETEIGEPRTDVSCKYFTKRWDPREILFDSRAKVFKDSRFISKIIRMSLAEFNIKYPAFKGKLSEGDGSFSDIAYQSGSKAEDKKAVTIYELEIKRPDRFNAVLVLANGIQGKLDYYRRGYQSNDFSIKYGSIDKYGTIYPMSRAKKAKKPQDDINHYLTTQYEHVDRSQRKIGYWADGLTDSGKAAVISADPFALVEKAVPQPVFEPMPAPSVVPENKEIVILAKDSINKHIGSTETAKSGKSDNEFATQDALENQAFQTNINQVQDALADVADQILDAKKDIIMQLYDEEDYFKITGLPGGDAWYTPEMGPLSDILLGDYLVSVDIVSASRPNPLKDRNENLELAKFATTPDVQNFMAARGKKFSIAVIENVVKSYNQNPEVVIEDIEPPLPLGGLPPEGQNELPPNAVPVPPPPGEAAPMTNNDMQRIPMMGNENAGI